MCSGDGSCTLDASYRRSSTSPWASMTWYMARASSRSSGPLRATISAVPWPLRSSDGPASAWVPSSGQDSRSSGRGSQALCLCAYAELHTYGPSHLDLEADLSSVGSFNAGQQRRALSQTGLTLPSAFGSISERIKSLELATFDDQDFPFWIPASGLMSTRRVERSPIPELEPRPWREAPAGAGIEELGLHWTPVTARGPEESTPGRPWVAGFVPAAASLARAPGDNAWGYGLSFSDGEYLGGRSSGAFGWGLRSGMIWSSRSARRELGLGWSVRRAGRSPSRGPSTRRTRCSRRRPRS